MQHTDDSAIVTMLRDASAGRLYVIDADGTMGDSEAGQNRAPRCTKLGAPFLRARHVLGGTTVVRRTWACESYR